MALRVSTINGRLEVLGDLSTDEAFETLRSYHDFLCGMLRDGTSPQQETIAMFALAEIGFRAAEQAALNEGGTARLGSWNRTVN